MCVCLRVCALQGADYPQRASVNPAWWCSEVYYNLKVLFTCYVSKLLEIQILKGQTNNGQFKEKQWNRPWDLFSLPRFLFLTHLISIFHFAFFLAHTFFSHTVMYLTTRIRSRTEQSLSKRPQYVFVCGKKNAPSTSREEKFQPGTQNSPIQLLP